MELITGRHTNGTLRTVEMPVFAQIAGRQIEGVILRRHDIERLLETTQYGPDHVQDFLEKLYMRYKPENTQ